MRGLFVSGRARAIRLLCFPVCQCMNATTCQFVTHVNAFKAIGDDVCTADLAGDTEGFTQVITLWIRVLFKTGTASGIGFARER